MAFAEDQHPVGDFGPGCEHEPFRVSVRTWAAGRDLHGLDTSVGQDCVERFGELSGPVANQEPEARGAITQILTRLRICWAVHGPSGFAVTPRMCT